MKLDLKLEICNGIKTEKNYCLLVRMVEFAKTLCGKKMNVILQKHICKNSNTKVGP